MSPSSSTDAFYSAPEDTFYSAPDSPPSADSQIHHQEHLSTHLNPTLADDDLHSTPPSNKWLSRTASSAGKVIALVLGLSDESESGSDEGESDWEGTGVLSSHEDKYEAGKRIEVLNKGMALGEVQELNAIMPLMTSEELVPQETLSREQSDKLVNPAKSLNVESASPLLHPEDVFSHNQQVQVPVSQVQVPVEIDRATVSEGKKHFEKNKSSSPSCQPPVNPNSSTLPSKTKELDELPLTNRKPPLNPNLDYCLSCLRNQQPFSDSIPPISPLPFPLPDQNEQHQLFITMPPVKAIMPPIRSEQLVPQDTLSRKKSEKPINPIQSLIVEPSSPLLHPKNVFSHKQVVQETASPVQASVEIHSGTAAEAKKQFEKNKNSSPSCKMPLNPNTSTLHGKTKELPLTNVKPPLNPNLDHCHSCSQNKQPSSDIIPPISHLSFPLPYQNQQQQLSALIPPVNRMPSPSLSRSPQPPSLCAPLLRPIAASSSPNKKQKSPHPSIPSPERHSKPCFKRNRPRLQCSLASSNHKVLEREIPELMVEEESGSKRWASNLKAVIELFSGDLNAKQPGDIDLLNVLEMKGITFEDPPWWPK